jgi:hypothetical protein
MEVKKKRECEENRVRETIIVRKKCRHVHFALTLLHEYPLSEV